MKKITVAIIMLNWNGIEYTKKSLDSVLQITGVSYKIFLIDNGSQNDEGNELKRIYKDKIILHRLPTNTGFTGGCNYGIRHAQSYNPEFFLLLNNDTIVEKDFLEKLVTTARSDKKIGIVSPAIYNIETKKDIIFSGGDIRWWFGKTFHKTDKLKSYEPFSFITGCCFLIKKEVIKKIGYLDSQFFAYFEDAAYCVTARKAGYICVCEPKAIIYHEETAASDKKGIFHTYIMSRNRILFVNSYAPIRIRFFFFLFNIVKSIGALFFFLFTRQYKRVYAYAKGYLDGNLGRGGTPRL